MFITLTSTSDSKAKEAPAGFHRLAPKTSVRGGFFMAAAVAVIWTLVTFFLLVGLYSGKDENSQPPVWIALIFIAVDLLIIAWAVKSFLRLALTGQTTVDVSSPTAFPGQPLEVMVSQPGQFNIDKCTVDLICQESATYTAGTDTVTKTEIVRHIPICDLDGIVARNGQTLTRQTIQIPADSMLSFKASNNLIEWAIRVKMIIPKRPDSEQLFPIRVLTPEIVEAEGTTNG